MHPKSGNREDMSPEKTQSLDHELTNNGSGACGGTGTAAISGNVARERGTQPAAPWDTVGLEPDSD